MISFPENRCRSALLSLLAKGCLTAALACAALPAQATEPAELRTVSVSALGSDFGVNTRSFAARRFVKVVPQHFDFSCGSAALATLLTYSYELPVDEARVLSDMYERGDKDKIHREGFSMLDMKNYLSSIGLKAEGYKESLDKLVRVGVPAIVLLNRNGYTHFVVVKGVTKSNVLVGDPAQGLRLYSRNEFESMWNKILFVVLDLKPIARQHFNSKELWAKKNMRIDSEMANLANDGIGTFTLDSSFSPGYY